jgi:hypothetical protein
LPTPAVACSEVTHLPLGWQRSRAVDVHACKSVPPPTHRWCCCACTLAAATAAAAAVSSLGRLASCCCCCCRCSCCCLLAANGDRFCWFAGIQGGTELTPVLPQAASVHLRAGACYITYVVSVLARYRMPLSRDLRVTARAEPLAASYFTRCLWWRMPHEHTV